MGSSARTGEAVASNSPVAASKVRRHCDAGAIEVPCWRLGECNNEGITDAETPALGVRRSNRVDMRGGQLIWAQPQLARAAARVGDVDWAAVYVARLASMDGRWRDCGTGKLLYWKRQSPNSDQRLEMTKNR